MLPPPFTVSYHCCLNLPSPTYRCLHLPSIKNRSNTIALQLLPQPYLHHLLFGTMHTSGTFIRYPLARKHSSLDTLHSTAVFHVWYNVYISLTWGHAAGHANNVLFREDRAQRITFNYWNGS